MTKTKPTYWVDLSDLSEWSGHYTGIQRVVFNIAKYYAERPDVKFFVFDRPHTGFFEVSFDIVKQPIQLAEEVADEAEADSPVGLSRRLIRRVPTRYKQRVPAFAVSLLRGSYRAARTVKNAKISRQTHVRKNFELHTPAKFAASDIVLVLGSPWGNPVMMPSLVNTKLQVGFKLVQVVYDLIPILMPYLFGEQLFPIFSRYLFDIVSNSDGLVAISQSSKHDVEAVAAKLNVPKIPVGVMRLGDEFNPPAAIKPKVSLTPGNFILCVGTFEIRKNHQLLYYVYKEAKQRGIILPKLVIVGRKGWLTADLSYVMKNDSDVSDNMIVLHSASDSNLAWLYQNCRFTVYPALYEGWGLPIAESLSYGKVCIAADGSSMTEIAPGLVEHFSPYDSSACLLLLEKYANDAEALQSLEQKIKQQYATYTWEETYQQFNTFVQELTKVKN